MVERRGKQTPWWRPWRRYNRYQWIQIRMGMLLGMLGMMLLAVVWRGHQLQNVQGAELEERQEDQLHREMKLSARRGSILDRNGVELAMSVEVKSIYANPRFIKNPEEVIAKLEAILGGSMNRDLVKRRLSNRRRQFAWVARRVAPSLARKVMELRIPGMGTISESQRYYPLKDRAGHVLGFVGGDEYRGLEGLELAYNDVLEGGRYKLDVTTDARGRLIYLGDAPSFTELEGKSLVLTLDERLQYLAETELASAIRVSGASSASVVISDPNNGDILAMTSSPTFNPNRLNDYSPSEWRNRATRDSFEPGSTFKSFVVAAALQEDLLDLGSMLEVNGGTLRFGDDVITDHHRARRLSVRDAIKHSSNIGAYRMAAMLERERFGWYIKRFGFGEKTGVPLSERAGRLRDPKRWPEITLANVSFGHGLTVTNLQMNMALATIANGGVLMKPRLVKEILDRDGHVVQAFPPEQRRRVLDEKATRDATQALMAVIEDGGTGTQAATAWYKVAGKTGTARKVDPKTRRYSNRLWTASFVGFVPAERPALVITVIFNIERDYRGQSYYGGKVAAPVFSRIASQALPMLGVMPDDDVLRAQRLRDYQNGVEPADIAKRRAAANARILARQPDANKEPPRRPPPYTNGVVASQPDPAEFAAMPSYINLSVRQALALSREHGHIIKTSGTGQVRRQWPGPGVFVGDDVTVWLEFSHQ